MADLVLSGNTSGAITLSAPSVAGTNTLTLPALTGTVLTNKTAGTVLQVVQATYNTQVTVSTSTYTDTGLSASITPTSTTSKILVSIQQTCATSGGTSNGLGIKLLRNGSDIFNPSPTDATGPYIFYASTSNIYSVINIQYLDSPSSTSSTTYKTQGRPYAPASSQVAYFQPSGATQNGISVITLMEIMA